VTGWSASAAVAKIDLHRYVLTVQRPLSLAARWSCYNRLTRRGLMGAWLCRGNDPTDFAGLILVKEVLQFWRCPETPRVSQLSMRPFPRLPADTPMFDMLRFFQVRVAGGWWLRLAGGGAGVDCVMWGQQLRRQVRVTGGWWLWWAGGGAGWVRVGVAAQTR
jgi:hypothetical protein